MEQKISEVLRGEAPVVLVTILARTGSTPRRPGTRMVVTDTEVAGSVGGGLVEAKAVGAARQALMTGLSSRLHCDMSSNDPGMDMICGGTVDLLVEPLAAGQRELFEDAARALEEGVPGCWLLDVTRPEKILRIFHRDLSVLSADVAAMQGKEPNLVEHEGRTLYAEFLTAPSVVLLCGGGHVAHCVAPLAAQVGFAVEVVDDRPEFVGQERFPQARATYEAPNFADLEKICGIGPQHYVVIATRGHKYDLEVLTQILHTQARYIGMIGSRKKRDALYATLREQGVPNAELACVRCPIGLAIGADSPEEIAISIVAELVAARVGRLPRFRDPA